MRIERAKATHLKELLQWLEQEHRESGEGFWVNRNLIRRAMQDDELWVVDEEGEVVGFQVGTYSPEIVCVRASRQRQGFGSALVKATIERAQRDNVNRLAGECYPRASLPFWQRHGFEPSGPMPEWGAIPVRLMLEHNHNIPAGLTPATVTISWFEERALYEASATPIRVENLVGARGPSGEVLLPRRVVALMEDGHGDLVVKIDVDGSRCGFCKAKSPEAERLGIYRDIGGGSYYLDAVRLPAR